jgi:hypothetical protein
VVVVVGEAGGQGEVEGEGVGVEGEGAGMCLVGMVKEPWACGPLGMALLVTHPQLVAQQEVAASVMHPTKLTPSSSVCTQWQHSSSDRICIAFAFHRQHSCID